MESVVIKRNANRTLTSPATAKVDINQHKRILHLVTLHSDTNSSRSGDSAEAFPFVPVKKTVVYGNYLWTSLRLSQVLRSDFWFGLGCRIPLFETVFREIFIATREASI